MKKSLIALCLGVIFAYASTIHEAKVTEVIQAGSYTYLGVQSGDRNYWAVVQKADLPVGAWVRFTEEMLYPKYHSKALERDFEDVVFASDLYYRSAEEASKHLAFMQKPLEKSPYKTKGTLSIAQIQEQKKDLKDRSITLRAKVVKVSKNILERNWVHLQDGTGEPNPGEPVGRIVATSNELPKVGDVVTVKGILGVEKEFGSGYIYPIIIEESRFIE